MTHPHLVAQQEDVILECIDSPDITIRIQALDLVQGMVTADSLVPIVSRLMKQLKSAAPADDLNGHEAPSMALSSDSDDDNPQATTEPSEVDGFETQLPDDYRLDVIGRILYMSSKDNYGNVLDFDWYIDVLTQLVRMAPTARAFKSDGAVSLSPRATLDISDRVGDELRNVAVKVRAMRSTAVRAGCGIVTQLNVDTPVGHKVASGALKSVTWVLGEYAILLQDPDGTMNSLLQLIPRAARPEVCAISLLAVSKIFATIAGDETQPWTAERKSRISLLIARILHVAEPLTSHPNLEVQERAVELVELLKLTAEAASGQPASTPDAPHDPPLLLTQAIPSLFNGWELNSVSQGAQRNVPMPDGLDLDAPVHSDLNRLLSMADTLTFEADGIDEFEVYYNQRPAPVAISSSAPAITRLLDPGDELVGSYQQPSEESYLDADIIARRRAERLQRNRDDPYYIPSSADTPRASTPIHNILQNSNGPDLDIDSIPIMKLELDNVTSSAAPAPRPQPKPRQRLVVAGDETLGGSEGGHTRQGDSGNNSDGVPKAKAKKTKQSLLQVDSSHIGSFSLEGSPSNGFDYEQQQREEAEMQQAMKEVERLRLEMQRANERIQIAQGVDVEGTVVKKKKKKKATTATEGEGEVRTKPKKQKKVQPAEAADASSVGGRSGSIPAAADDDVVVLPKKKKKKRTGEVNKDAKKKMAEIQDVNELQGQ